MKIESTLELRKHFEWIFEYSVYDIEEAKSSIRSDRNIEDFLIQHFRSNVVRSFVRSQNNPKQRYLENEAITLPIYLLGRGQRDRLESSWTVWPDWAIFEIYWLQIFLHK